MAGFQSLSECFDRKLRHLRGYPRTFAALTEVITDKAQNFTFMLIPYALNKGN